MRKPLARPILLLVLFLPAPAVLAQERFSIFVGSDPANVERMLELAELRDGDREVRLYGADIRVLRMTVDGAGYALHELTDKVNGNAIEGTARILLRGEKDRGTVETVVLPRRARRVPGSGDFAPTGLDALRSRSLSSTSPALARAS